MMKQFLLALLFFLSAITASAQVSTRPVVLVTSAPTTCLASRVYINTTTKKMYSKQTASSACQELNGSVPATGITATAVISDNAVVRGDGGGRGVQSSGIIISDSNGLNCTTDGGCDIGNGLADFRDASLKRNLILRGSTSGKITFAAAATTTDYTFTWPSAAPGANTFLKGDGTWAAANTSPAGSDTEVQFNDGGAFGADPQLLWNKTTNLLTVTGPVTAGAAADAKITSGGDFELYTGATRLGRIYKANGNISVEAGVLTLSGSTNYTTTVFQVNPFQPYLTMGSAFRLRWNSTVDLSAGAVDTGMSRNAAGVMEVNNGTAGGFGKLLAARVVTAKTGDYTVTDAEKNVFFTNVGAGAGVIFTLPTPIVGQTFEFYRDANQTVTVDVGGSITIRVGTSVTTAGGNVTLDAVGSRIRLVAISTTQWVGDVTGATTFN